MTRPRSAPATSGDFADQKYFNVFQPTTGSPSAFSSAVTFCVSVDQPPSPENITTNDDCAPLAGRSINGRSATAGSAGMSSPAYWAVIALSAATNCGNQ